MPATRKMRFVNGGPWDGEDLELIRGVVFPSTIKPPKSRGRYIRDLRTETYRFVDRD